MGRDNGPLTAKLCCLMAKDLKDFCSQALALCNSPELWHKARVEKCQEELRLSHIVKEIIDKMKR